MDNNNLTLQPPFEPAILSMEVDDEDASDSEYRLRFGNEVKYLIISPGTFDRRTLSFPIPALPHLPYHENWTVAHVSRDRVDGELKITTSSRDLASIKNRWHNAQFDVLKLERVKQLSAMAFEAVFRSAPQKSLQPPPAGIIAKIARFEWELSRIERETRAYQLLEGSELAPRFLGHIHENGRVIGFLTEKVDGRPASVQDLGICVESLKKLHGLGHVHGDPNRYNFLISGTDVKLLDFEHFVENASAELMQRELDDLQVELVDDSGRGAGFIFSDDAV